jgi:TonB family protein
MLNGTIIVLAYLLAQGGELFAIALYALLRVNYPHGAALAYSLLVLAAVLIYLVRHAAIRLSRRELQPHGDKGLFHPVRYRAHGIFLGLYLSGLLFICWYLLSLWWPEAFETKAEMAAASAPFSPSSLLVALAWVAAFILVATCCVSYIRLSGRYAASEQSTGNSLVERMASFLRQRYGSEEEEPPPVLEGPFREISYQSSPRLLMSLQVEAILIIVMAILLPWISGMWRPEPTQWTVKRAPIMLIASAGDMQRSIAAPAIRTRGTVIIHSAGGGVAGGGKGGASGSPQMAPLLPNPTPQGDDVSAPENAKPLGPANRSTSGPTPAEVARMELPTRAPSGGGAGSGFGDAGPGSGHGLPQRSAENGTGTFPAAGSGSSNAGPGGNPGLPQRVAQAGQGSGLGGGGNGTAGPMGAGLPQRGFGERGGGDGKGSPGIGSGTGTNGISAGGPPSRNLVPATTITEAKRAEAEQPVKIISKPRPSYTQQARERRVQGDVIVEVIFTSSGEVRVLRIVQGLGYGLDESAKQAVAGIRFEPAQQDGKAIDVTEQLIVTFRMAEHS